ncbi:MAG: hypothetical protein LBD77_11560 [Bifidobacteriaceae bacterium]|nr:hypothetical protein [Bifidobacteriaceae bacterium]
MRPTLGIDDDVYLAARDIAALERRPIGAVLSDLARQALRARDQAAAGETGAFCGFRPLPRRGVIVSNELVNSIREEDGI